MATFEHSTKFMVLVTGASGLVGSQLVFDLLSQGYQVKALVRSKKAQEKLESFIRMLSPKSNQLCTNLHIALGDILDVYSLEEALKNVTKVYHCAAVVSFNPSDRDLLYKVNIEGTANVVNACLDANVEKLAYVSSTSALGKPKNKQETVTENTKWNSDYGHSQYGISKHMAEREVWRGVEEGLPAVVINPSIIIGPGDFTKSSIQLIDKVYKGLLFYTKGANAYVDVRDVSRALIELMESQITNEKFLVTSENYAFKRFFTEVANALKVDGSKIMASALLSSIAWRLEAVKSFIFRTKPLITKETTRSANSITTYSNSKIKKALGFEFIPVKEAIEHACFFYLKAAKK